MVKFFLFLLLLWPTTLKAADWPREIDSPKGTITLYQPQIDSYSGNSLSARAAISIVPTGKTTPIFGAVWLDCRVSTDRPTRTVELEDVKVTQIKFPNGTGQKTDGVSEVLEEEIPRMNQTFSLDELLVSLEEVEKEKESAREIGVTPPKIIVVNHPAVLVLIDGDPVLVDADGTSLKRVANTPYFLVKDPSTNRFYLKGGEVWYGAMAIKGPWQQTDGVPGQVAALWDQAKSDNGSDQNGNTDNSAASSGKIPEIIVSTEPAELIASDGPVQFSPISGVGLLYASNTQSKLFLEITSQEYFILISGRWYKAKKLTGPWTYNASDKLPEDFAKIPPGSEGDDVLASIAGTTPAREAVLDTQIPQTAEVDRQTTTQIEYDGDPQFEPVEGTEMTYAVNTPTPVVYVGGQYYACDKGVWFESVNSFGPWMVCTNVPAVIYTIPPRSPIYYVRYVRVYTYTPTAVYVGYTAGYTGSYVYNGTVVYGTGFYYRPWHRHYYYPRPWTWGFGVHYDPWTGWSIGFSAGWWRPHGWFAYGWRGAHSGWWGPVGYRPVYRPVVGPMYRRGYHPVYRPAPSPRVSSRPGVGARPATLYDRWATGVRRPSGGSRLDQQRDDMPRTSTRPRQNNVYAAPDGNVLRKTDKGWQQRDRNTWKPARNTPDRASRVERDATVRQRAAERSENLRPQPPKQQPSGRSGVKEQSAPREKQGGRGMDGGRSGSGSTGGEHGRGGRDR